MVTKDYHPNEGLEVRDHASLKAVQDYSVLREKLISMAGPEIMYHQQDDAERYKHSTFDLTQDSDTPPPGDDAEEQHLDDMMMAEMAETRGESTIPAAPPVMEKLAESKPKVNLVTREVWLDDEPQILATAVMVDAFRFGTAGCNAVITRKVLPIKIIRNAVCIGLTCSRPMGAYGEPIISAPFAFVSDIVKYNRYDFGRYAQIYCAKVRPMAAILTGREEIMVVWDDNDRFSKDQIVWFPLEMVPDLLHEPMLEDISTMLLLRWVEKHEAVIRRQAYSRDEYNVVELPVPQTLPVTSSNGENGNSEDGSEAHQATGTDGPPENGLTT